MTDNMPPLPLINDLMREAGWQNSALRQADLEKCARVARAYADPFIKDAWRWRAFKTLVDAGNFGGDVASAIGHEDGNALDIAIDRLIVK